MVKRLKTPSEEVMVVAVTDELRVEQGLNFAVRMGINSGEVVVAKIGDDLRMDYTAQGHTVGLAARMEQIAEPGKAYLTEHTAELVSGFFQLSALGRKPLGHGGGDFHLVDDSPGGLHLDGGEASGEENALETADHRLFTVETCGGGAASQGLPPDPFGFSSDPRYGGCTKKGKSCSPVREPGCRTQRRDRGPLQRRPPRRRGPAGSSAEGVAEPCTPPGLSWRYPYPPRPS